MGVSTHDGLRRVALAFPGLLRLLHPCAHAVSPTLYWRAVSIIISKGLVWPKQWLLFLHASMEEAPVSEAPLSCPGLDWYAAGSYWYGTLAWTGAGGTSDQRSDLIRKSPSDRDLFQSYR